MEYVEIIRSIPGPDFIRMFIYLQGCCIFIALLLKRHIYPSFNNFVLRAESPSPEKSAALRGSKTHTIMISLFELYLHKIITVTNKDEPILVNRVPETVSSLKKVILSYLQKSLSLQINYFSIARS